MVPQPSPQLGLLLGLPTMAISERLLLPSLPFVLFAVVVSHNGRAAVQPATKRVIMYIRIIMFLEVYVADDRKQSGSLQGILDAHECFCNFDEPVILRESDLRR